MMYVVSFTYENSIKLVFVMNNAGKDSLWSFTWNAGYSCF